GTCPTKASYSPVTNVISHVQMSTLSSDQAKYMSVMMFTLYGPSILLVKTLLSQPQIFYAFNNFALIATIIVLKLIKMAPTAGLKTIPIGANTPAANGMTTILYPDAHHKFCTIFLYVFCDKSIIDTTSFGLLFTRTISAVSIATSVPAPIAIPKSAVARAGASFTPSPVIATFQPFCCISFT